MNINDKKTICIVSSQVSDIYSGPGLYTKLLVEGLVKRGFQIVVISTNDQTPHGQPGYIFISAFPMFRLRGLARWIPFGLAYDRAIKKLSKSYDINLIHFIDFREALFCSSDKPIIANVNDTYTMTLDSLAYYKAHYFDWAARYLFYKLSQRLEKHFIYKIRLLMANSQFTLNTLKLTYPTISNKVRVIYKSIDSTPYLHQREVESKGKAELTTHTTVLFVGTNMQRKGIITLINSANDILMQVPECKFLIVGKDRFISKYKKIAQQNDVLDKMKFLGHRSQNELYSIYQEASIFVLPSLTEAFGVAVLEAIAAGAVPVVSNVGGLPEIIQDEVNGLLVPPDDPKALTCAIIRLLKNPDLMDKLRTNGRVTLEKFSHEEMVSKTIEVYNELIPNQNSND